MGDVVNLFQKPTAAGQAFCMACNHEWVCVAEVGTHRLECPDCHRMTGMFKFEFAPPDDMLVMTCECGSQLFYMTPSGMLCPSCGDYQRYG